VLFIHASNLTIRFQNVTYSDSTWLNVAIQNALSNGICRTAVPLFFAISGYLFFTKIAQRPGAKWYLATLLKRARTLAIPYFIWSAGALLLFAAAQQIGPLRPFFSGKLLGSDTLPELLYRVFLNPLPFQFWFLRDLIAFTLISPALFLCIRRMPTVALGLLAWFWLGDVNLQLVDTGGLLFFVAGGALAVYPQWRIAVSRRTRRVALFLWLAAIIFNAALSSNLNLQPNAAQRLMSVLGVAALWLNCDALGARVRRLLASLAELNFFIFASHEPLLTTLKKVGHWTLGFSQGAIMIVYFVAPLVTFGITVVSALMLRRLSPAAFAILTGGRGLRKRGSG
jgi:peptidoglycan/LPS O-acetylase OafA/YrhL